MSLAGRSLESFAAEVLKKCAVAPAPYRFGRKTFIAALALTVEEREKLVAAHRAGFLELSRADLTPAFDRKILDASELVIDLGFIKPSFHFIAPPHGR